ncbi:MAG TPA: BON domain-containing protein [Candidatus Polarisedimenticolaceae bacterium]|nr:BON domain-containing protein [Candidatus Polarisedimenticolaceae bacterium]
MRMKLLACALPLLIACGSHTSTPQPDNTGVNERDRAGVTLTPGDQAENETDRTITQDLRRAIVADDALTVTAQNVKIITANGVVTLRGPVRDDTEKDLIASKAQQIAGVTRVDNQLEVVVTR